MRCQSTDIEIDDGVRLHIGFDKEDGFASRGYVKMTPYEARRLASDLMDYAAEAEAVANDEALDRYDGDKTSMRSIASR